MSKRKRFLLRLTPELYAALEAWAQQEMRSVNSQIEYILREAVRRRQRSQPISSPASAEASSEGQKEATVDSLPSSEESSAFGAQQPPEEGNPGCRGSSLPG